MQSKTIALIFLLLYKLIAQGQTNYLSNSNIPEGYNTRFTASTENKWDKKRINAFIVDKEENIYQGQLLYMNDQNLLLYASDSLFYKNPNKELIYRFTPDNIKRIYLNRHNRIGVGIITGATLALAAPIYATIEFTGTGEEGWLVILIPAVYLGAAMLTVPIGIIGGYIYGKNIDYQTNGDSASFKILAEELNNYTLYKNTIPQEFVPKTNTQKQKTSTEKLPTHKERKRDLLDYNKWDIGVTAGYGTSLIKSDVNSNIRKSLPQNFHKSSDYFSNTVSFDFGYRFHKNIRAGIEISGWNFSSVFEDYDYNNYENPYTSFYFDYLLTSFALKCDYIYQPVRRLMSRRSEFSVGLSYSSNSIYTFVFEDYYVNGGYMDSAETDPEIYFNSQINASLGYDLYIFRFLSARFAFHAKYAINEMETAVIKLTDVNNIDYIIPKTTMNTSSVSAEFGLRFHF